MPACRRALVVLSMLFTIGKPCAPGARETRKPPQMVITVDARTPWKQRIPVRMRMTATAGPLRLVLPGWLPGMHGSQGPLANFSRLNIAADGTPLAWNRDPFDITVIHIDVPAGARTIEASYDYVAARNRSDEVFYGVAAGQDVAVLNPSAFSLAPQGDPHSLTAKLSVSLPKGWSVATALPVMEGGHGDPDTVSFAPVSLYTLIDSPIMAGSHHKTLPLAAPPGDVPHALELFADTEEILQKKAALVTPLLTRLTAESGRMFGSRHYHAFRFMLALSTQVGRNGLEHHEGVAYVLQPDDFDENRRQLPQSGWNMMLIPHEFAHSWNGKYRRPYGEDARTNTAPQSADLIWVYEGLTQYLGDVLMVRSGFRSLDAWRRELLARAVTMRFGAGREWQSLADTALAAPYTYIQGQGTALRGVNDVYYEGELNWLEADAIIRRESRGARSLGDFCRLFFGGVNKGPEIARYTRKDIVEALNRTQPYNWAGFIEARFYGPPKGLPTAAFEAAGWTLAFKDTPESPTLGLPDYRHTFGALVLTTGSIRDVVPESLAERAGLEAGMELLGVNGSLFTAARLQAAVQATKGGKASLELLVASDGKYRTIRIDGLDGERHPILSRDLSRPDLLSAITASAMEPPVAGGGLKQ